MDNSNTCEPDFRRERFRFLKNKAQLDLLSVNEALEEIAVLVQDAGECVALANEIRDAAKNDLELAEAKEANRLRKIPLETGKPPSEQAILSKIPLSDEVQNKIQTYSSSRLDSALWATIANSLMTKSSAIRTAADLIACGYLTQDFLYNRRRTQIRELK